MGRSFNKVVERGKCDQRCASMFLAIFRKSKWETGMGFGVQVEGVELNSGAAF